MVLMFGRRGRLVVVVEEALVVLTVGLLRKAFEQIRSDEQGHFHTAL